MFSPSSYGLESPLHQAEVRVMKMKATMMKLNQKGQLTMDFLFACILIMGVSVYLEL